MAKKLKKKSKKQTQEAIKAAVARSKVRAKSSPTKDEVLVPAKNKFKLAEGRPALLEQFYKIARDVKKTQDAMASIENYHGQLQAQIETVSAELKRLE